MGTEFLKEEVWYYNRTYSDSENHIVIFDFIHGNYVGKNQSIKPQDSKSISTVALYLVTPCSILNAFQADYSAEVRNGLLLALFTAVVIHIFLLLLNEELKRFLKLDEIEQMSLVYSNAGNLVIPLISSILGPEYVIYTCAFLSVQNFLIWSHGKAVLCGEKRLDLKKVLAGKRLWMTVLLRLVLVPLCTLCIIKFSGLTNVIPNGSTVLLITLIATITPSASSITNMSQVYGKNASYASAINMASTLLCVLTMPVIVALYQF